MIIEHLLSEITLRVPEDKKQRDELVMLMSSLSKKMPGSEDALESAKEEITKGNWDEALDLIKTYFIMKKIPVAIASPARSGTKL